MRYIIEELLLAALCLGNVESKKIPLNRKVCPILGPLFPKPTNIAASPIWRDTISILNQQIDTATRTSHDPDGFGHYANLSYSIGFFSVSEPGVIYERYQTSESVANSSAGTHHVDGNSIYQIGSISKLLTAYVFLLNGGDKYFYYPITHFVPELLSVVKKNAWTSVFGAPPKWDEVAVIDIASHTAGIYDDYGLDDVEIGNQIKGLPKLSKDRIPVCQYQTGLNYHTCTKQQLLEGIANLPALFQIGATPSYSNAGYDLMGFVIEGLTNRSMAINFNETLVKPLNLTHTYYNVPPTTKDGVIPLNEANAGWNYQYGPTIPDGANFVSTYDFAKIGKSIMNSTLLPQSVTNRWIKPHTFTYDPRASLGAPWEIWTWVTTKRNYELYTKEGENGRYATLFVIVPDLGVGYSVMMAGTKNEPAGAVESLSGLVANATLPMIDEIAKQQAHKNFAGTYAVTGQNSSVVVTTDNQPGLKVTQWIYNGTDLLQELKGTTDPKKYIDFRLWPNELYSGNQVGFSGVWNNFPTVNFPRSPLEEDCQSYGDTGSEIFGGVDLAAFRFDVGADGVAQSLTLQAFPLTLMKTASGGGNGTMNGNYAFAH